MLLAAGARTDLKNKVRRWLLALVVIVSQLSQAGQTALELARRSKQIECIAVLGRLLEMCSSLVPLILPLRAEQADSIRAAGSCHS